MNSLLNHNWSGENWEKFLSDDRFIEVLRKFDSWGVKWFPMFGTLLAMKRDGKFIEGSGDIDLGILAEDLDKIQDFGGIADTLGGRPVYWNYQASVIVNVQAWTKYRDKRYYISENFIQQELKDDIEELLTDWYGDWKTPKKGVHSRTILYKITFDTYDN